jgi:hypothetical protein
MDPRGAKRLRAAQIAALGLVWAIGAGVVWYDRVEVGRQNAAGRAKPTAANVAVDVGSDGPLDCLATAASGSIEIRSGTKTCCEFRAEQFRIAWTAEDGTFSFPAAAKPSPISREARQQFATALAREVQRPDDGGQDCTVERFVELTWRCEDAAPVHASFSEGACAIAGLPPPTGSAHRVHEALVGLVRLMRQTPHEPLPQK